MCWHAVQSFCCLLMLQDQKKAQKLFGGDSNIKSITWNLFDSACVTMAC